MSLINSMFELYTFIHIAFSLFFLFYCSRIVSNSKDEDWVHDASFYTTIYGAYWFIYAIIGVVFSQSATVVLLSPIVFVPLLFAVSWNMRAKESEEGDR